MKKSNLRIIGSKTFSILVVLFLTACGDDSRSPVHAPVYECEGEDVYGPEGGTIEITDANSAFYGLRIVIPAGAIDGCRSFYVDECFVSDLPKGCTLIPITMLNLICQQVVISPMTWSWNSTSR